MTSLNHDYVEEEPNSMSVFGIDHYVRIICCNEDLSAIAFIFNYN